MGINNNKGVLTMSDLITKALNAAGYTGEPTEANLIECYLDYADCFGGDIEELREDIQEGFITVKTMCNALIRCN
jgi:hypothetical protein